MKKDMIGGKLSGRQVIAACAALVLVCICAALIFTRITGGETVKFEVVKESQLPHGITSDIIPEYKTLERALACMDGDDIYVIVTRGEKPTSGYTVSVEKIELEKKNNGSNLVVYAAFSDPSKKTAVSQIITYPVQAVRTDLKKLPDSIELRIQYE
ncbi:MAG: protease complex subunit PrcB family protein [Clostridiales bacterium]|nr:protease complex subunit PrcB family protein [Clostridiales bacterium]